MYDVCRFFKSEKAQITNFEEIQQLLVFRSCSKHSRESNRFPGPIDVKYNSASNHRSNY